MFNYALTLPVGDILLKVVIEGLAAGFIAVAFAMLFSVPKRYLPYVYLGGAITKALRTLLFTGFNMDVAIATFIACTRCCGGCLPLNMPISIRKTRSTPHWTKTGIAKADLVRALQRGMAHGTVSTVIIPLFRAV